MSSESVVLNLSDNSLWAPYKGLFSVIYNAISQKDAVDTILDLESALKKHKPDLICLLKNPSRNAIHREAVKRASGPGISIVGRPGPQVLPQNLVDEALIISDMFELNELTALELLIAGQQQQPRFPGLTRGLVATLLYYDGRRNLVNALQLLVQAREGPTWSLGINNEISSIIMNFTNQLKEEGVIMKVIDLIENMDITKELDLLHRNRALGGPKYRKQVTDLINEIKQTLAEILFGWACQGSFSKEEVIRLLNYLSQETGTNNNGSMNNTTLTVVMAFLYVIDVSMLQTTGEINKNLSKLEVLFSQELSLEIHKILVGSPEKWKLPGLKPVLQLSWGITLRTVSQYPTNITGKINECLEDDDRTVDSAIENNAFQSIRRLVVENSTFHEQEFFLKRIHSIITDFIVLMPLKLKELRNRGDETARIIASHSQEGLEPPTNLPLHFEHLLNLITDMYAKDSLDLELTAEYWCPSENVSDQTFAQRSSHRQIALYKFVRLAGDLLPPQLFVPYHQMLTSLSNSPSSAHNGFSMLKINGQNGSQPNLVSWDHFFATLHRYYASLHEEMPPTADRQYSYPQRMHSKGIAPQEVHGLIAVLQLISKVAKMDEIARITLAESPQYVPAVVLLGLVTCSVPATLKAELINCLAAFATSPEIASNIWLGLEMAQVIPSVKSVTVYYPSGILMELEEVETRMEEYPVTRAMLSLLDVLLTHPYPNALGAANRQPGVEPYLQFVRDSVLLRSNSRSYKNPGEKWKVMSLCLKILEKVLKTCHFHTNSIESSVGISILTQMLQDSGLLRIVLLILDEGVRILDQYASVPGQSDLEECTLYALKLLHVSLTKQDGLIQLIRDNGCDLLVTSLENLLLNINPRTGQADHLLVVAKYVTYNIVLPTHSLYSISILNALCNSLQISKHLVGVFNSDQSESETLLKGFVEVLEVDVPDEDTEGDKAILARSKARQQLFQLLLKCLKQPGPNVSHYLLGFNLRKPISETEIQEPGVMGSRVTCLHAAISFLDSGGNSISPNLVNAPFSSELAFQFIYTLCTSVETSGPTLRYLRSTHDFISRHLEYLPFKSNDVKHLRQQSWLLRTLAVELRVTSAHHQRSHVQRLLNIFLDDVTSADWSLDFREREFLGKSVVDNSMEQSLVASSSIHSFMKPTSRIYRRKIMRILDSIDFEHSMPSAPQWDYFESEGIERLLVECEIQNADCPRMIDIQALHSRISEETLGLQNQANMGQRPFVSQEISQVLEYAVVCNEAREAVYAKKLLFEAWGQVAEVVLISCPLEIFGADKKEQMVLEVSQELLSKIMLPNVLSALLPPASGVILSLMSALRCSMIASLMRPLSHLTAGKTRNQEVYHVDSPVITLTHHSALLAVLRSVVECLLKTGTGLQRVRANFYSAFLNLLCIVQKPCDFQNSESAGGMATLLLDQESEAKKLRTEYMEIILSFGGTIMEVICRDACTGHDITRMLALAVLDVAVSLDSQQQWLAFMVSKGYLRHILDGLSKDDEELQNLFDRHGNSPRVFYVFESKMALLTRISCTTGGALALLRNATIHKLAECRVLDLRPDLTTEGKHDWQSPDLLKFYRQMFMAIMRLILSITMTLGSSHREATLQLLEFIVCNGELFNHVIRESTNIYTLEALEELSVISALLSRASFDDPKILSGDSFLSEQRGNLLLLRQQTLMLIPRLMAVENIDSSGPNNFEAGIDLEAKTRMKIFRLQIVSHVLSSCCNMITKSGMDPQHSSVLFGPYISEASSIDSFALVSTSFQKKSSINMCRSPDLGLLITLLHRSASDLQKCTDEHKVMTRRLQSISTLTTDELAEYLPSKLKEGQTSVQYQREHVWNSLQKLIKYKSKEMAVLISMIETAIFILLRHLEYFFVICKKENLPFTLMEKSQQQMRRLQDPASPRPLSPQNAARSERVDQHKTLPKQFDYEFFKSDVQAMLGEPFFRKLKSIEQQMTLGGSRVSFYEAILNRLKRLVKIQIK